MESLKYGDVKFEKYPMTEQGFYSSSKNKCAFFTITGLKSFIFLWKTEFYTARIYKWTFFFLHCTRNLSSENKHLPELGDWEHLDKGTGH